MNLHYEALGMIMASLSPQRKASIQNITQALLSLNLSQSAVDTILAAIILETAEVQFVADGGLTPPVRESALDVLKPIFESKKTKTKKN